MKVGAGRRQVSAKPRGLRLVVPGPEQWERWFLEEGGAVKLEGEGVELAEVCVGEIDWLGLPQSAVILSPLRLATTEEGLFESVVDLHWEKQGLQPLAGSKQAGRWRVLAMEGGESRLVAFRTVMETPATFVFPAVKRMAPAVWMRSWPNHRVILTKELGRGLVVVTGSDGVIYQALLCSARPGPAYVGQLRALLQNLSDEGWLEGITGIEVQGSMTPGELQMLEGATGLKTGMVSSAPLREPAKEAELRLPALESLHKQARQRSALRKSLAVAMVVAGLALVGAVGYALVIGQQLSAERAWLAERREKVEQIEGIARTWTSLEEAIDPDRYVLEDFFRTTQAMPPKTVRLIRFEQRDGSLILRGEAQNPQAAFEFLSRLQQSEMLSGYRWNMPAPNIQPNDLALFQIVGTSPYATVTAQ